MDAAYISALAALVGSAIGGLTSLSTTWLTQHGQAKMAQITRDRVKRETLFAEFIEEASRLYADAFTHDGTDLLKLSKMYAMISRMRVLCSKKIVIQAEEVGQKIVAAYLEPNKTFKDVLKWKKSDAMDPLKQFSEACREELQPYRTSPMGIA